MLLVVAIAIVALTSLLFLSIHTRASQRVKLLQGERQREKLGGRLEELLLDNLSGFTVQPADEDSLVVQWSKISERPGTLLLQNLDALLRVDNGLIRKRFFVSQSLVPGHFLPRWTKLIEEAKRDPTIEFYRSDMDLNNSPLVIKNTENLRRYFVSRGTILLPSGLSIRSSDATQLFFVAVGDIEISEIRFSRSEQIDIFLYSATGGVTIANLPAGLSLCSPQPALTASHRLGIQAAQGSFLGSEIHQSSVGCRIARDKRFWGMQKLTGEL